eukprot:gb/GECH01012579.1/.p1 GENE.gb/GECH01012579.1/~~gb/GECH01012579.1/.p1  ORF type:complete len:1132 (+),score=277.72 gb/GECH01012579.1/:1-3396(+)
MAQENENRISAYFQDGSLRRKYISQIEFKEENGYQYYQFWLSSSRNIVRKLVLGIKMGSGNSIESAFREYWCEGNLFDRGMIYSRISRKRINSNMTQLYFHSLCHVEGFASIRKIKFKDPALNYHRDHFPTDLHSLNSLPETSHSEIHQVTNENTNSINNNNANCNDRHGTSSTSSSFSDSNSSRIISSSNRNVGSSHQHRMQESSNDWSKYPEKPIPTSTASHQTVEELEFHSTENTEELDDSEISHQTEDRSNHRVHSEVPLSRDEILSSKIKNELTDNEFPFLVNFFFLTLSRPGGVSISSKAKEQLKKLSLESVDPYIQAIGIKSILSSRSVEVETVQELHEYIQEAQKDPERIQKAKTRVVNLRILIVPVEPKEEEEIDFELRFDFDFDETNLLHAYYEDHQKVPSDHIVSVGFGRKKDKNASKIPISIDPFKDILDIFGREYYLFACSASDIRESRAKYLCKTQNYTASSLREWLGNFESVRNQFKYCARLGQPLSTGIPSIPIFETECSVVDDVKQGDYNFTDGCGIILESAMRDVYQKYCDYKDIEFSEKDVPSAIQIRIRGIKGMLLSWPDSQVQSIQIQRMRDSFLRNDKKIVFTKSMEKFDIYRNQKDENRRNLLFVLETSNFVNSNATLNYQIVSLLTSVIDKNPLKEILTEIIDYNVRELDEAIETPTKMLSYFSRGLQDEPGSYLHNCAIALLYGHDYNHFSFVRNSINQIIQDKFKSWKDLKIPVKNLVNLLGVFDPTFTLEEDEVYFHTRSKKQPQTGDKVFITKNPCLHPGDVQLAKFKQVPELNHLENVVVFGVKKNRPLPNKISGGDLDGDRFFVCWEESLIQRFKPCDPADFDQEKSKTEAFSPPKNEKEVNNTIRAVLKEHHKNNILGWITNLHSTVSSIKSVQNRDAIFLAQMASIAVDSAKNGTRELKAQMATGQWKDIKKTYNSKKIEEIYDDSNNDKHFNKIQTEDHSPTFLQEVSSLVAKREKNFNLQDSETNCYSELLEGKRFYHDQEFVEQKAKKILIELRQRKPSFENEKTTDISTAFVEFYHMLRSLFTQKCNRVLEEKDPKTYSLSFRIAVASKIFEDIAGRSELEWITPVILPELNKIKEEQSLWTLPKHLNSLKVKRS